MKKALLFAVIGVFLSLGAMSQENLLKGGDFESPSDWDLSVLEVDVSDITVSFDYPLSVPKYGDGTCLRLHWNIVGSFEMFLYQRVYLKPGKTYEFSGAFKDAGTNADATYFWSQIVIIPVNGASDLSNGPDWGVFGMNAPLLLSMGAGWYEDDGGGLGQDTTYTYCSAKYYGSFTGVFDDESGQGDTTIFTVGDKFPTTGGGLELGDSAEFFVALYLGQGGLAPDNNFDFTFDNFSLHEYEATTGIINETETDADYLSVYPNPVQRSMHINSTEGISAVSVVNIVGQEVMRVDNMSLHSATINTSGLDGGIYFIRVTDPNGVVSSRKIIKE